MRGKARLIVVLTAALVAAMSPAATAEEDSGVVAEAGDATIAADPQPQTELVPDPPPDEGSGYGSSTALSGPTALVGAPFEDDGTVRVFTLGDDNSASQTGTLSAPAGQSGFGSAVATDGATIVVGAPALEERNRRAATKPSTSTIPKRSR